jgi:heme/copper-type cytochrome/quinol oxidase subunit 3
MKSKKPFLNMDERSKLIAYKVIAIMYFLTILAIEGVILYRQFALGQSIRDFEDLAIILTVNSLFLISALLYFGAIPIQKLKIRTILWGYLAIVVLGAVFTYLKYNIFQSPGLTFGQLVDKLLIISAISGLIVGFFILFSFLGIKRLDKELE